MGGCVSVATIVGEVVPVSVRVVTTVSVSVRVASTDIFSISERKYCHRARPYHHSQGFTAGSHLTISASTQPHNTHSIYRTGHRQCCTSTNALTLKPLILP
ncbi:unnamed protein product [Rotaria socialis]|uniref:Uncharacterized protein n=1 Tax=Rotaria socialis TaxID=392032 RepID=A0A818FFV2_9BILA|nr:unnamed protein product [Rotaria socialis]